MRILLIDDIRDIKADIIARTYAEGIQALKNKGPFNILYLDHDLGDFQLGGREQTGYDIMCFLEVNLMLLPWKIQIVSSNPVGRQNIQRVIDKLYRNNVWKRRIRYTFALIKSWFRR